jgi:hypothetical protein
MNERQAEAIRVGRRMGKTRMVEQLNKAYFVTLSQDIILSRKGNPGEPKTVVTRLPEGSKVLLVRVVQNPTERTPLICYHKAYPYLFRLGRNNVVSLELYDEKTQVDQTTPVEEASEGGSV